jgi:hypothetical protein
MSDTKLTNSAECAPTHWAIVAWNQAGEGLLFDADTKIKNVVNDWAFPTAGNKGAQVPEFGVGMVTMRWVYDFDLNSERKQIWSFAQR